MADAVAVWVPGRPKTERKRNIRFGQFNRTVDTPDRADWKADVRLTVRRHFPEPLRGPLVVTVYVVRPTPGSTPQRPTPRVPWPWAWLTRPDADNYAKLCHDALNGVAYTDDGQIVAAHQHKLQWPGAPSGLLVTVRHALECELRAGRDLVEAIACQGSSTRRAPDVHQQPLFAAQED